MIVVLFEAECVVCFVVCLSFLWFSCIEEPLCNTIVMTVKHVFKRNLNFLTQLFNCFPTLFYCVSPQYLLSWRASALVYPHRWALLLLAMENMCLATTFTQWKGSARKDGSGIPNQVFFWMTSELDFRHLWMDAWAHCLSTTFIVLWSLLIIASMIKKRL